MKWALASLVTMAVAAGCTDLPAGPGLPDFVTTLRFVETCPVIPVNGECTVRVEGRDQAGNPVLATNLTWSSSRPGIFTVSGSGTTATLTGHIFGEGILRVETARGISVQTTVRVVTPN